MDKVENGVEVEKENYDESKCAVEAMAAKQDTKDKCAREQIIMETNITATKQDDIEKDAVCEHNTTECDASEYYTNEHAAEQDDAEHDTTEHSATEQDTTEHDAIECDAENDATEQDAAEQDAAESDVSEHDATKHNATEQDVIELDLLDDRAEKRRNKIRIFLKILEVSMLVCVMLLLIGLFLIPTFFYALSSSDTVPHSDSCSIMQLVGLTCDGTGNVSDTCEDAVSYSGEICADVFIALHNCSSNSESLSTPDLNHIPSSIDQIQTESTAHELLMGLDLLSPSAECSESIKPFLCLYLFDFCGSGGLRPSLRRECLRLRDDVCSKEWATAMLFLSPDTLPECEDYPDKTKECNLESNDSTSSDVTPPSTERNELNCSDGFFHDENNTGLCRPKCGEFRHKGYATIIPERIAMCISLIASVVMFILAFTYQKSTLLTFPSNLLVYLCGTTFLLAAVIAIGSIDNRALFCSTEDQIIAASKGNQTAYCTFSGIVFYYTLAQTCVWALLHAIFLFWSLIFPFSYRRLRISGKARYAHVISVLVALLTPLPGALAPLKDGYLSTRNPSLVCQARNADYIYFFLVLPLSVVLAVSSCLMVVTFWIIFKEFVLKKLIAGKKVGQIGKAEIKMAVISSYYIIVGVLSLFTFTYFEVKTKANRDSLVNLFLCESSGNLACEERVNTVAIDILNILAEIVLVLVAFFPVVALLFSYDTRTYKKVRGSLKITSKSSMRTSSLHKNLPVYRSKS